MLGTIDPTSRIGTMLYGIHRYIWYIYIYIYIYKTIKTWCICVKEKDKT